MPHDNDRENFDKGLNSKLKKFWKEHEELRRQALSLSNDTKANNTNSSIPLFGGRPQRDITITKDEIINLKIALETTDSVDAFEAAVA